MLAVSFGLLATSALMRPYADVQRSWLVAGASLCGLLLLATIFAPALARAARAMADEWRPR